MKPRISVSEIVASTVSRSTLLLVILARKLMVSLLVHHLCTNKGTVWGYFKIFLSIYMSRKYLLLNRYYHLIGFLRA